MKSLALLALLISSSAHAQESEARPVETITATPPVAEAPHPRRQGFTFELGLGAGGTSDYITSTNPVTGVFTGSVGGFVNNRTALLVHFAGASNTQYARVDALNADRYHSITSMFLGPQLQYFLTDRFMVALGVGGVLRLDSVSVDVRGTTAGDSHDWKGAGGIGGSARAAFTVYQRRDAAALRIGVEALPSYVGHDWHTSVALMGELQAF